MTLLQKLSLGYFVALMIAASLNYIPGLTDEAGLAFGIFALDIYDDALHVASALWALVAALLSHKAVRNFLILFGFAYLGDGIFGFFVFLDQISSELSLPEKPHFRPRCLVVHPNLHVTLLGRNLGVAESKKE